MFTVRGGVSIVIDDKRDPWLGFAAVKWVIDDAPVPADLAFTLVVIARRCGPDGTGSFQSVPTIAAKTGLSEKQARRNIVRLRELGLIVLGDQELAGKYLPAGQRPTVYDVPLSLTGVKPAKESRNPTGLKAGTPPMDGTPPLQGTPATHAPGTPPIDGGTTPPFQGSQRDHLDLPVEEPSLSARIDDTLAAAADLQSERDASAFQDSEPEDPDPYAMQRGWLRKAGVTDETELLVLPALIEEMHHVEKPRAWWPYVHRQGDLIACVDEARAQMAASRLFGAAPATAGDSWCGECEPNNRWRETESGQPYRCPKCHPERWRDQPRTTVGYQPFRDADRDYHSGDL